MSRPAGSTKADTQVRKTFPAATIKSFDGEGSGSAVIATLNVMDSDGDITLPGAFGTQKVKLAGGHDWEAPTLGIAEIRESGDEVIADFKFNLEIPAAKDWYSAVKFNYDNGVKQEYSYGFRVKEWSYEERDDGRWARLLKRLDVFEVSFVMAGAGVDTRTLDIKSGKPGTEEDEHGSGAAIVADAEARARMALANAYETVGSLALAS